MSHQQEIAGSTPKETLYINNLNDKINQEDMKYGLYFLFQQFGEILDIILKKSNTLRGQAWIIFKDITAATNAKKNLNGFLFFDKELKINFAKQRSEILDKLEGRWVPKKKQKKENNNNAKKVGEQEIGTEQKEQQQQKQQLQQIPLNIQQNELNQPNNVLILEDLPSFVTTDILKALFGQYPGFKEVRLIAPRKVAFVEFSQEDEATVALNGLQNFQLTPQVFLKLNYAKF
ncbi:U1 small nuclear ribonucleoprotein A (macronuclear) [Tetrahymena thermophila SB210]|uniref:U1 small nuclear ribonucleoprotein A n=1 Tax=Tetrahymena thermophila (strain SB210) TaxID=312017 RepID=Q22CK3_TETTS|nr:U1 small nuclear ribonucleoprotein A [Tetrahymena thermophila SB210]EAR82989.2 U1 small nuclear ribonucleoprotein A [Tetrahymena thermophila SB210]|eukprot:XP_001030652.2 U1 small nuclear ribonucleoprotein A [Tetrahymena thermophila SB210]